MKRSELRQIIKEEIKYISEASEVDYNKMPEETKKILKKAKMTGLVESSWSGIHGNIINFEGSHGADRVNKNQLSILLKDPNLRWIDIEAIGV